MISSQGGLPGTYKRYATVSLHLLTHSQNTIIKVELTMHLTPQEFLSL